MEEIKNETSIKVTALNEKYILKNKIKIGCSIFAAATVAILFIVVVLIDVCRLYKYSLNNYKLRVLKAESRKKHTTKHRNSEDGCVSIDLHSVEKSKQLNRRLKNFHQQLYFNYQGTSYY